MGRSYNKGEGRESIGPSPQQLENLKRAEEAGIHHDSFGHTEWQFKVTDIGSLKEEVKELGLSKQRQKEILEKGLGDDDYLILRVIQLLEDEKKGKVKNDENDKNFKFSMNKLIERWKNGEVELIACFDKKGRFIGFHQGNEDTVTANIFYGMLAGGSSVHIHPTNKNKPLGFSFSRKDFLTMRDYGMKKMVVTTREGTFTLEAPSGRNKVKNINVNEEFVYIATQRQLGINKFDEKFGGHIDPSTGRMKDTLRIIQWRDHHEGVAKIASRAGLKYTFKPNKGYEFLVDPKKPMQKIPEVD